MIPRLQQVYREQIKPALMESLGRKNVHSIPKAAEDRYQHGRWTGDPGQEKPGRCQFSPELIAGQKPVITNARKSIAGFKLREGMPIGCKVTLRGRRMYEFLDRLLSLVLPRVRDFRGVSDKAFDGRGNYSLGLTEYLVFPELNPDKFTPAARE